MTPIRYAVFLNGECVATYNTKLGEQVALDKAKRNIKEYGGELFMQMADDDCYIPVKERSLVV